ncbi:LPS export ABC transporter ATP-binding protein [Endomicrobium proavitum]|uniref:Putative lipopolysaccharide transport protein B: ATP-binding component of ABC superfamily n=1 Tax=Endomicrobium proavitum TaxID=1408281 RepID=A0A0G3WGL9_9BACT|nr:LPS export ABC transporter ATP-binding protein [Endomicrobium proavitum]AKL97463.1 putative lipopolysaccharide transport protein B: ATP-binding component of ABC superfamily [Endomicrobium proavitum]
MILRSENLFKKYKYRMVVNGISISVKQGEVVGLLGPNGAGKTTTFYMTVGLIKPYDGNVYLGSDKITDWPMYMRARSGIGYLSQESSIFRGLSVRDNLMAIAQLLPVSKKEQQEKVDSLLEDFGLTKLSSQMSVTLSGGEKRRLEIARALVNDPKFLLLDEPFVGIDPITVDDIQRIIKKLKAQGLGILITDHNVRETLEIIDRAYIIYEGKILLEGNAKELLENPKARQVYLGDNFKM